MIRREVTTNAAFAAHGENIMDNTTIYLNVAHVGDDDCDYYMFKSFKEAAKFIQDNVDTDFILSTSSMGIPEHDYELIESTPNNKRN